MAPTEHPASTRSESMSEEVRGNSSHDLPAWLQEFRHNLVDESVPEQPRAKVVSGKHSIFCHFPKDRNCDICVRTKITRASCSKRTGTGRAQSGIFDDLITADHKVLSDECESVVQDLATQWIQSYPGKKNFSANRGELAKVLGADEETKSHLH